MFNGRKRADSLRMLWAWADLIAAVGLVIAVCAYLSIGEHSSGGMLLSSACVLAGLGYLMGCVIAVIAWAARRRWTRAGTSAAKAVAFVLLWPVCGQAGDLIHLALFYPAYRHEIDARRADDTVPIRFDWGDKALWITDGLQADTLVYDPTDALARTIGEVRDGTGTGLGLWTRHLVGHFYIEREFSR